MKTLKAIVISAAMILGIILFSLILGLITAVLERVGISSKAMVITCLIALFIVAVFVVRKELK